MGDSCGSPPPLWERYLQERGRIHLTGLQALVRLPLEQVRRDRVAGLRVGAVISGYPGSPLAGLDQTYQHVRELLDAHDVRFVPALNEELAASVVGGSQLVDRFPHASFDGAVGIWFGKAPGLDRALDALRHSNFMGTARFGGALAVVGDDPSCKSSSLPSHSEHAFAHALMPLLVPADAGEVLELGLHGFALSRYAGLYCGLKIVADVADGGLVFDLPEPETPELPKFELRGRTFRKRFDTRLLPPYVNRIEAEILWERLEAVRRYAFANGLDRIHGASPGDRIGFVASGRLYRELQTGLRRLGIGEEDLDRLGLRLFQVRMVYPLEPRRLLDFAEGLHEIVCVDERRGFLEDQVRATLCTQVDPPLVLGQRDEAGQPWLARHADISSETLALDLAPHLSRRLAQPQFEARVADLRACAAREAPTSATRAPHFCSGCPHTRSTRLPAGSKAGGGIGCHTMALLMDRDVQFVGAMGSEGAHWIGLAPFVDTPHLFQNLGDGTYFHSGRLAVRACVEAGATLTFKLLYNGSIAMTGGQQAVGAKSVCAVVRELLANGVRRVVAASDDPELRALAKLDHRVECITRERFDAALLRLREQPGVTVALYDRLCANHKQRLERRGVLAAPGERVVIHADVCEGCGDCMRAAACASLRPTDTPLGRKTRVHESSCADDRTCLHGDCPSFLVVSTPRVEPAGVARWVSGPLPDPEPCAWRGPRFSVAMVGIGSTGVVTIDALLVRAAELEGLYALHVDQTGLAQRGGKVTSHCVISRAPLAGSARVGWSEADTLLAFDPLGAADAPSLRTLDPDRTRAVAHAEIAPTADALDWPDAESPALETLLAPIRAHTVSLDLVRAEALAEAALGQPRCANVVVLGFALQRGLLPVTPAALERAIHHNDVAVDENLAALRLGRALAVDQDLEQIVLADAAPPSVADEGNPAMAHRVFGQSWRALESHLQRAPEAERESLLRSVAGFATDLADYQSRAYAERYLRSLEPLARVDRAEGDFTLSGIAARELYRLMAYKDEYEVARLLLRGPFRRWLERHSQGRLRLGYRLHPPLLRALGLEQKLALGRWVEPLLAALLPLRKLRGTWLDLFGHTPARRAERELVHWYLGCMERIAARLDRRRQPTPEPDEGLRCVAGEILSAAAEIRGFEQVKLSRIGPVRRRVDALLERLEQTTCR